MLSQQQPTLPLSSTPEDDASQDGSEALSQFQQDGNVDDQDMTEMPMDIEGKLEERDELKEIQKLAKTETRRVVLWKIILLTVIAVAAALVTAGTHRILTEEEEEDFLTAYRLFSNNIKDAIQGHYNQLTLASKSAALAITGSAETSGETFPYVTIKDYEVLGASIREKSGIEVMTWQPYVPAGDEDRWNNYSIANQGWLDYSRKTVLAASADEQLFRSYTEGSIIPMFSLPGPPAPFSGPMWQQSPPPFRVQGTLNFNIISTPSGLLQYDILTQVRHTLFGEIDNDARLINSVLREEDHEQYHERLVDWNKSLPATDLPHFYIIEPVYEEINNDNSEIVGQVVSYVGLDNYVVDLLPDGIDNITLVLRNNCNQSFTYDIRGSSAYYQGPSDMHDPKYDGLEVSQKFYGYEDDDVIEELGKGGEACIMTFHIYPTTTFESEYRTNLPLILSIVVGATFAFMAMSFFIYDWFQNSRNRKVVTAAASSNAIVSSMFPSAIRDKLLEQQKRQQAEKRKGGIENVSRHRFQVEADTETPMADFYPACTIMFCDIVGFTAWSSVREPTQVFELLEAVYSEFDICAQKRHIFKVETVGDSYVAAAGLPNPRKDHFIAMSRFARDCSKAFETVVNQLEVTLGPETGELSMRFGLHSGPVTAGVLRGDRARFQLFGDTMNTASRMESTGKPNRIQVSHDTAELLRGAGKGAWITPREEMVQIKGKGMMVTYWLSATAGKSDGSVCGTSVASEVSDANTLNTPDSNKKSLHKKTKEDKKAQRLVQWNVGILSELLGLIVASNKEPGVGTDNTVDESSSLDESGISWRSDVGMPLDEVQEAVSMARYDPRSAASQPNEPANQKLDEIVENQLQDYVRTIAEMYSTENAFHNLEHAAHVAMAERKLLSRVVNPKINGISGQNSEDRGAVLHDFTFGITSDPLVQFACVFSALIHDVGHPGVPNAVLLSENEAMANAYGHRSIAEQNSFDLAWNLLMDSRFAELRRAISGGSERELKRFRQIVINVVMATDVIDKDLNAFRAKRWDQSFGGNVDVEESAKDKDDRKATIVIEHMIQASDIAHTMQHWHIYRKWNQLLFQEMYTAYADGRTTTNPAEGWFEGELGFFDHYVIPLAKKLDECGVFGVVSSEYLSYAERNRKEWEDKGRTIVEEYLQEFQAESGDALGSNATILEEVPAEEDLSE